MALAVSVHPQQTAARVRPRKFEIEMRREKKTSYQYSSPPATAQAKRSPVSSTTVPPSWLLSTIADLDERMKAIEIINSDSPEHTFAQRAETYYRKRPQLLSLLQDLYNGYLSLCDRYLRGLAKRSSGNYTSPSSAQFSIHCLSDWDDNEAESEVESSLSYQNLPLTPTSKACGADMLVAELVIKNVEHDLLLHEVGWMERESYRKIEIHEDLLEVMESERMILLSQNSALRFQVRAVMEENRVLVSESELMKARAMELAKCVWKIREEGCVGELGSRIEELQGRVLWLEKENKEYYDEIARREMVQFKERDRGGRRKAGGGDGKRKAWKLWTKVKRMDIFKFRISPACGR